MLNTPDLLRFGHQPPSSGRDSEFLSDRSDDLNGRMVADLAPGQANGEVAAGSGRLIPQPVQLPLRGPAMIGVPISLDDEGWTGARAKHLRAGLVAEDDVFRVTRQDQVHLSQTLNDDRGERTVSGLLQLVPGDGLQDRAGSRMSPVYKSAKRHVPLTAQATAQIVLAHQSVAQRRINGDQGIEFACAAHEADQGMLNTSHGCGLLSRNGEIVHPVDGVSTKAIRQATTVGGNRDMQRTGRPLQRKPVELHGMCTGHDPVDAAAQDDARIRTRHGDHTIGMKFKAPILSQPPDESAIGATLAQGRRTYGTVESGQPRQKLNFSKIVIHTLIMSKSIIMRQY